MSFGISIAIELVSGCNAPDRIVDGIVETEYWFRMLMPVSHPDR